MRYKVETYSVIYDLFDCNHKSASFVLISRAWRRILNFSEDQLNRPEAATVLWRWVMDRIRMKRKMVSQTVYWSCDIQFQISFHLILQRNSQICKSYAKLHNPISYNIIWRNISLLHAIWTWQEIAVIQRNYRLYVMNYFVRRKKTSIREEN